MFIKTLRVRVKLTVNKTWNETEGVIVAMSNNNNSNNRHEQLSPDHNRLKIAENRVLAQNMSQYL